MAICEKTGLTFEAKSKRQRNHPAIMVVVNEANKDGWYNQCLQACETGKDAGLSTLQEFLDLLDETRRAWREQRDQSVSAYLDRKRAEKEARRDKAVTNSLLAGRGYTWSKLGFKDEEEADAFDINAPIGQDWQLFAPDSRAVTVRQAMEELAAQNVKFARDWLEEHSQRRSS